MATQNPGPPYKKPGAQNTEGSGLAAGAFGKAPDSLGDMAVSGYNSFPVGPGQVSGQQGASNPVTGSFDKSKVGMTTLQDQS